MTYFIRKAELDDLNSILQIAKKHWKRIGRCWTCRQTIKKWIEKGCVDVYYRDDTVQAFKVQNGRRIYSLASIKSPAGILLLDSAEKGSVGLVSIRNKTAYKVHISVGFTSLGKVRLAVGNTKKWFHIMLKEI